MHMIQNLFFFQNLKVIKLYAEKSPFTHPSARQSILVACWISSQRFFSLHGRKYKR